MTPRSSNMALRTLAAALAVGGGFLGGGCRGDRTNKPPRQFFPDMDDQARYDTQNKSTFFADGRVMREPVPGTVAFAPRADLFPPHTGDRAAWQDWMEAERADLLREDSVYYTGRTGDGAFVATIPVPVTESMMRRGQERFNIYCTPCHGYTGDGKGMVGRQWSYDLPDFHDPKFAFGSDDPDGRGTDGFIFHTIRNGVPNAPGVMPPYKMPPYAEQVSERDAWAIVAYFRALRRSQATPFDSVPERFRPELERTRASAPVSRPGAAAPAPATEAAQ